TGQRAVNPEEARCVPTEVAGQKRPADALPDGRNTSPGPPGSHVRVTRINTFVALLVAAILIAGCSETVSVRSGPLRRGRVPRREADRDDAARLLAAAQRGGRATSRACREDRLCAGCERPAYPMGQRTGYWCCLHPRAARADSTYALCRSSVRGARASPSGVGGSRSAGGRGAPKPAGAPPERA